MYHEGSSVASDDATGVLQLRERGREVRHCSTQRGGGGRGRRCSGQNLQRSGSSSAQGHSNGGARE
jgi:hypothetical protein